MKCKKNPASGRGEVSKSKQQHLLRLFLMREGTYVLTTEHLSLWPKTQGGLQ